jgi:chromosome segregation ATPase
MAVIATAQPPKDVPPGLTERESRLLKEAGDHVSSLAQRLATARRDVEASQQELRMLQEVLAETRRTRDVLSAQVSSLQEQRERDYDERAELRRLLAAVSAQFQAIYENGISSARRAEAGRVAPQRTSEPSGQRALPTATAGSLRQRARKGWARLANW